jgi:hypothetical protein
LAGSEHHRGESGELSDKHSLTLEGVTFDSGPTPGAHRPKGLAHALTPGFCRYHKSASINDGISRFGADACHHRPAFFDETKARAVAWLSAWDSQGHHRTGTTGDEAGALWLAYEAAGFSVDVATEAFTLNPTSRIRPRGR